MVALPQLSGTIRNSRVESGRVWSRISGLETVGASGLRIRASNLGFRVSRPSTRRVLGFGFWVSDVGFWVSGLVFRVSGFGFQVSGVVFRVSGVGFLVSYFGFWVSGSRFLVSSF